MSTFRLRPPAARFDGDVARRALAACATPLPAVDDAAADRALDPLLDRVGDAAVVLLGEASHGTAGYYDWRRRISERLILERGFDFVAVEGDWPDCADVDRYVRGETDGPAEQVLRTFERWPTWMWANREVAGLIDSLRAVNADRPGGDRVGFYGLDVYSLWDSLDRVRGYLAEHAPEAVDSADEAFACFGSEFGDEQRYARRTERAGDAAGRARLERPGGLPPAGLLVHRRPRREVVRQVRQRPILDLLAETRRAALRDGAAAFDAEQNALVARGAEEYYRTMTRGGPESWNVRDRHMTDTLARLLDRHSDPTPGGRRARGVVWEHNTHVGDARATDMAAAGMVNVGRLARERFGPRNVVLVGFGSHRGTVIAGRRWGGEMRRMRVPAARDDSWEGLMHAAFDGDDRLLIFPPDADESPLRDTRGHRAIGVVYRPEAERGNFVPTRLSDRYDAFLYLDETHALHPLHAEPVGADDEVPETYPSGV